MIAEVEAANRVAQTKKQEQKQIEVEEDLKIVRYNQERDAKENARLAEERRVKEEKEKEI